MLLCVKNALLDFICYVKVTNKYRKIHSNYKEHNSDIVKFVCFIISLVELLSATSDLDFVEIVKWFYI